MKTTNPIEVSILGGGAFGSILAHICASLGHRVILWLRDKNLAAEIGATGYNTKYAPNIKLASSISPTTDMDRAVHHSRLLLIAIPSKAFHQIFCQLLPSITPQHYLISTTKGLEPDRFRTMSQIMAAELSTKGYKPDQQIGVLSGPNLASELAAKHITGTVIASHNSLLRQLARQALETKYFHIFESDHVYGVELGGALKNIYAIAAGIADALGFGMNTKSILITRALMEMSHLATKLQVDPISFLGLTGIGDLIVTCSSPHSRNYRFGQKLAEGQSVDEINKHLGGVAEGVHTTKLVYAKAQQLSVSMPLLEALHSIIFQKGWVRHVLWKTLRQTPKTDVEYLAERT